MPDAALNAADLEQLRARGIAEAEARRQLGMFERPPAYADLVRPSTVGDGILRIGPPRLAELTAEHRAAAGQGRFTKFVPASGAASRMFRELHYYNAGPGRGCAWNDVRAAAARGAGEAAGLVEFIEGLPRFAFHDALAAVLERSSGRLDELVERGDYAPILAALLGKEGLGYESSPKGLLAFHKYPEAARTSLEEHLVEAAHYVRADSGCCRLHLTVSPEHRARFEKRMAGVGASYESRFDARFEISYSEQKPSTDTLAADPRNRPFRDESGRLVFRPGGHGALIENLADLAGDLVYVKNIDNVQPDWRKQETLTWKIALGGHLAALQRDVFEHLAELRRPDLPPERLEQIDRFVGERLHVRRERPVEGDLREWLADRLDRPLRVCGVVPNTGEPGGGPFWVRGRDGVVSLQIVETAQIDPRDDAQQGMLGAATHFNPVDLVCAVRDAEDRPYDLHRFIDREAVFISSKSHGGRELKALELPGLWNGAMAGWNTVFVEIPLATFSPVKTVLDLLRPEHQPG